MTPDQWILYPRDVVNIYSLTLARRPFILLLSMLQIACSSVSFTAWITSWCLHSKANYTTSQGPNAAAPEYR